MNKRFVYFAVFTLSLFSGTSTPNLRANEEITEKNVVDHENELDLNKDSTINKNFLDEDEDEDTRYYEDCDNSDEDDQDHLPEEKTSFEATLKRTILKSAIETLSTSLSHTYFKKINTTEYEIERFRYDELAKILLNLAVDESVPNPKSNLAQKLVEFLVPTITAFLVVDCAKEAFVENETFQNSDGKIKYIFSSTPKLCSKLFQKLVKKFFMVRFLQKPGTRSYDVANTLALTSAFYEFNSSGKNIKEACFSPSCIKIRHGIEQVVLDQARIFIETLYISKDPKLRPRKKAVGKIVQLFLKPQVQEIIVNAYEYRKNLGI